LLIGKLIKKVVLQPYKGGYLVINKIYVVQKLKSSIDANNHWTRNNNERPVVKKNVYIEVEIVRQNIIYHIQC
jgi:hypothetical protein